MKTKFIFILLFLIPICVKTQEINEGILEYWDFETIDGGSSQAKGKLNNAIFLESEINGNALCLKHENSSMSVSNVLSLFDQFSICFWFKIEKFKDTCTLFNQFNSNGRSYKLNFEDRSFVFKSNDEFNNFNTIMSGQTKIELNKWYFFALTAKNSNLAMQLDNTVIMQIDNFDLNIRESENKDSLIIGASVKNKYSFIGMIDEFIIYNRELSSLDKKELFLKKFPESLVQSLEPPKINGRSSKIDTSFIIDEAKIKIEYFDDLPDDDQLSIYFNNKNIVEAEVLTRSKKEISLDIKPYQSNYLTLYANNLGKVPPNTAQVIVYVGRRKYELTLSSDMTKSSTIEFKYIPKK